MKHRYQHWSKTLIGVCALALASCGGGQAEPEEPLENTIAEEPAPTTGTVSVACDFENGWYSLLPEEVYGTGDDQFLMQALIGFTNEPDFWVTLEEYKKYEPYAAKQCGAEPATKELDPGNYVLLIGWAGQFEKTGYKNNGRIEKLTIEAGDEIERQVTTDDLDQDMPCISCPFLLVLQDGEFVELGQILIDRYVAAKQGTDARRTRADVEDGLITIRLAEREPEVSYIDAVEVWHNGKRLEPAAAVPDPLHTVDGAFHTMAMGESVTMQFRAPVDSGSVDVEIRVNGYYLLDR